MFEDLTSRNERLGRASFAEKLTFAVLFALPTYIIIRGLVTLLWGI